MNTTETISTLLVTVVVAAVPLFYHHNLREREKHELAAIAKIAEPIRFDLSCSSEGDLDTKRRGNCFERNGYRFIREGMGTSIARIDADGLAEIVYRIDMRNSFGSLDTLIRARVALNENHTPPSEE